jgi:hypothetical protein
LSLLIDALISICDNICNEALNTFGATPKRRDRDMPDIPIQYHSEHDYADGYARVMRFAEQAHKRGWRLSERQLVHEIVERERAARMREKSSLPMVGQQVRSAAWNRGEAEALRDILRKQREGKKS